MTTSQSSSHDLGVSGPLINGEWLDKASLGAVDHIYPATARVNGAVMLSGPDEVDAAVAAAKAAFPEWRAMSPDKRRRILQKIEDLVEAHVPELGRLTILELGLPVGIAMRLVT
jgi:acyl-CoA reductase-like NAD-dependent aldehyde dehydrogenase